MLRLRSFVCPARAGICNAAVAYVIVIYGVSSIPLLIRAGICDAEVAYAPTIYVVFSLQLLIRSNFSIHLFSVGVSDVLFFDSDAVAFE